MKGFYCAADAKPSPVAEALHVVAGIVLDSNGHVLIARRHAHAHQGGLWEFPGGKVEEGESPRCALARELEEELGIRVVEMKAFMCVPYRYAERFVLLDFWIVAEWSGEARGLEGQEIAWRRVDSLLPADFPPADEAVLVALQDI